MLRKPRPADGEKQHLMADTQWPRFEVFQQDRAGRPHRNVGNVHAPDPEMALMNARDVFARRPSTVSMWVVPEEAILARTAEELAADPSWSDAAADPREAETYYVFQKRGQRRAMTFVEHSGEVEAASSLEALRRAVENFDDGTTYVWWVFPERAVVRSEPVDVDSMFAPADDKSYRLPREYRVLTEMLEIKRESDDDDES
jgi:ring-1,2-phenylacetyl-CoA epoxidase subunit PaaB